MQPELVAFCWWHTCCSMAGAAVAEVGLGEIDVVKPWRREQMPSAMKVQLALAPTSFLPTLHNPLFEAADDDDDDDNA